VKLPFVESVVVETEKVRDYLLSSVHPVGKFKAAYFAELGYQQEEWFRLVEALLAIAQEGNAVPGQLSQFGHKYEISATLVGPSGRSARVVTVWMVRHDEQLVRFVTALPGAKI
jgi:hypothetical protein